MATIGSNILFYIPQIEEERQLMERIDKAASVVTNKRYRVEPLASFMHTTIATVYFEAIVKYLSLKISTTDPDKAFVNFQDMAEFRSSYRVNSDAEKEGNINVIIKPGRNILTRNFTRLDIDCSESGFIIPSGDVDYFNDMRFIDQFTKKECYEKNSITLTLDWLAHTIALVVFESAVQVLYDDLLSSGGETQSLNFNDVFAMHVLVNPEADVNMNDIISIKENVMVVLKPLKNAKLLIKSDEANLIKED